MVVRRDSRIFASVNRSSCIVTKEIQSRVDNRTRCVGISEITASSKFFCLHISQIQSIYTSNGIDANSGTNSTTAHISSNKTNNITNFVTTTRRCNRYCRNCGDTATNSYIQSKTASSTSDVKCLDSTSWVSIVKTTRANARYSMSRTTLIFNDCRSKRLCSITNFSTRNKYCSDETSTLCSSETNRCLLRKNFNGVIIQRR